jgi:hypothetical protein
MSRQPKLLVLTVGMFLSVGVSAYATTVDFTFGTQTIGTTTITGLSSGATAAQITAYMTAVLVASGCSGCTATAVSSGSIGAVADQTYTADGNVTGPGTGSKSYTLGDSTGPYTAGSTTTSTTGSTDTFIANTSDSGGTNNGGSGVTSQITIQFKNIAGLTINSFDYEIFPDISCTALSPASDCGGSGDPNRPDLVFEAGNNTSGTDTVQQTFVGVTPGTTNGNATHSPTSGGSSAELAPQLIGTWTGSLTGDTELDFVDWPATIGIDNLQISYGATPVPEPAGVALFGTLVFLLAKKLRKV